MANITAYDPKDCNATFNGIYITGFSEDMIEGSKDEENFSSSVGAQGDVVVSEVNNSLGTIKFTLQATSPQKAMLIDAANNGTVAPVWISNEKLGERFGGSKARIKKPSDAKFGKEVGDKEFELQVFDFEVVNI